MSCVCAVFFCLLVCPPTQASVPPLLTVSTPTDAKHRAETEVGPQTRPRSNTLPKSFGSTLEQSVQDTAVEMKGPRPTREETLELIQRRVKGKRQEDGWPDDIKVGSDTFSILATSQTHGIEACSSCCRR